MSDQNAEPVQEDLPEPQDDGGEDKPKRSQATELVELALERFDLGVTEAGDPYAVERNGANIALTFRGGRSSLGSALARSYFDQHRRAVTAAARADALAVLEGMAADLDPVEPGLRVARDERGRIVVDLANSDGWAVVVDRHGYEVVETSPVLFRRTNLTLPLPCPVDDLDGSDLSILRDCINVSDRDWQLLVGFLVAALIPEIPHPILALFGEQGTGKTTAGRMIGQVIDQSSAPLRTAPRNEESWALQAAGSWVVVLDNLSSVQAWLSDALCRAVTGDGWVRRTLYTNADVSVLTFRRVVVMTSIDAGAMRGDLAERLLPIELQRIDSTRRRTETSLLEAFADNHHRILGGLFGLVAQVLDVLPDVELEAMPRLADFARVLAAVDKVTGWSSLDSFLGIGDELASDVVDSDPVAAAVAAHVGEHGEWQGTAGELLQLLSTDERNRSKDWPTSAQAMAGAIKRAAVVLRSVGVNVEHGTTRSTRRTWFLTRYEQRREPSSTSSTTSTSAPPAPSQVDDPTGRPARTSTPTTTSSTRQARNPGLLDDVDDLDDPSQHLSHDLCEGCGDTHKTSFSPYCIDCQEAART